jgi:hypothetical protein
MLHQSGLMPDLAAATPTSQGTHGSGIELPTFWDQDCQAVERTRHISSYAAAGNSLPLDTSSFLSSGIQEPQFVPALKMIVAGDYVTPHMVFTGTSGQTQGKGQSINFIATDLLKVTDGGITDNWHIEDNLTLMKQFGLITE